MRKQVKIPFEQWKEKQREIDLNNSHVSMDGSKEPKVVTVKPIKVKAKK